MIFPAWGLRRLHSILRRPPYIAAPLAVVSYLHSINTMEWSPISHELIINIAVVKYDAEEPANPVNCKTIYLLGRLD